jgi:flagellar motor switch protein FliG
MTQEGDEAARALRKLQDLTTKYSTTEMDGDELRQSISERINATEELKEILKKATEAKKKRDSYRQWRASD